MAWILVYNRTRHGLVIDQTGRQVDQFEFTYANQSDFVTTFMLDHGHVVRVLIDFDTDDVRYDYEAREAAAQVIFLNGGNYDPPPPPPHVNGDGKSAYELALEQGFTGSLAQWLDSLRGPIGPMGVSGPQGVQGPVGPLGPQGIQGVKGDVGPQGPVGPQGDRGDMGFQGLKGDPGNDGATGPQGPTGLTGPQGVQGPQGAKGDTGPTGPQGQTGSQGPQGPQGQKGDTGNTGPAGPQGPQGLKGDKGDKGDAGTPGATGPTGPTGSTGATGAQGPVGPQGTQGTPGQNAYVVYNTSTSSYPTRPPGVTTGVTWVGPVLPPEMTNGDVWINPDDPDDDAVASYAVLDAGGLVVVTQLPTWLQQTYVDGKRPKPVLNEQFNAPLVIAHRGGHLIHGEHSRQAYDWVAEQGFAIELDLQILSDGRIACCHDGTTGRTMLNIAGGTADVDISTIDSVAWKRDWRVLPQIAGSTYEEPMLLEEVLDLYGGRCLIVPECKDSVTRTGLVAAVKARGLEGSVLAQSFNFADVQYTAAQGLPSMILSGGSTPETYAAAGVGYYGGDMTLMTDDFVNALRTAGLRVIGYTVNSRYHATQGSDALRTKGYHGWFSDDPGWTSGKYKMSYRDPYRDGYPWAHLISNPSQSMLAFKDDGFGALLTSNTGRFISQDWCPKIASGKVRIDFEVVFQSNNPVTDQTRWASIAFGQIPDEAAYTDLATANQNVFHCLLRRNGQLQVYTNFAADSGPQQKASFTQAAALAPASQERVAKMRFVRDGTSVSLTNRETGESVSYADSTNVFANSRFSLNAQGTSAIFRNVHVTPL